MKKSTINKLNSLILSLRKVADEMEALIPEIAGTELPKIPVERKIKFAERVALYKKDHELLVQTFGDKPAKEMIAILDAYKQENNRHYKNDMGAIRNWVIEAWGKRTGKNVSPAMLKVELFHTPENTAPDVQLDDDFDVPPER